MTHIPIQLPFKGYTEQTQFSAVPEGMTPSCLNVMPSDVWNGRIRISTRNGTRIFDAGDVQFMGTYRAYEGNSLVERLIFVRGGKVYYADPNSSSPPTLFGSGAGAAHTQFTPFLNTTGLVEGVQFNNRFFFVDGTNYTIVTLDTPSDANAVGVWGNLASPVRGPFHTDPSTPASGERATLICRWGARIVLAGFKRTPNIWYACEPDAPYLFRGTTGTSSDDGWEAAKYIGAISGTTANEYGTLGDPIVAIFPFAQSGLMFACTNSFSFLTADPVFEESVNLVGLTRSIGIAGRRAWCQSQEKGAFILASDGLYFINANDFNFNRGNRVSAGRLDSFFLRLDFGTPAIGGNGPLSGGTLKSLSTEYGSSTGASVLIQDGSGGISTGSTNESVDLGNVAAALIGSASSGEVFPCLCYDPDREGVWIFLSVSGAEQTSVHLYYDLKTDSFWPQKFADPSGYAPTSAAYTGPTRSKYGRLFMGGSGAISIIEKSYPIGVDGWVSEMGEDDQRARLVRSSITLGPIIAPLPYRILLNEIRVDLNEDDYELPTGEVDVSVAPTLSVSTGDTAQLASGLQTDSLFSVNLNPLEINGGNVNPIGGFSETYDGNSGTNSIIDGRFAIRPFGEFVQRDPFAAGTSRVYDGPWDWIIRYDSGAPTGAAWTIERLVSTNPVTYEVEYYQTQPDIGSPNGSMITNVNSPNSSASKDFAAISGASFPGAEVTEIGTLNYGRNQAFKARIRSEAMYVTIASDGKPWSLERMSAVVSQVGKSRGGT